MITKRTKQKLKTALYQIGQLESAREMEAGLKTAVSHSHFEQIGLMGQYHVSAMAAMSDKLKRLEIVQQDLQSQHDKNLVILEKLELEHNITIVQNSRLKEENDALRDGIQDVNDTNDALVARINILNPSIERQQGNSPISDQEAQARLSWARIADSHLQRERPRHIVRSDRDASAAKYNAHISVNRTGEDGQESSNRPCRSRSLSKDRITQLVMGKLQQQQQQEAEAPAPPRRKKKRPVKMRSEELHAQPAIRATQSKSHPRHANDTFEAMDDSLLPTNAGDTTHAPLNWRSGSSSTSSINNSKLLATVDDAIMASILPELKTLKDENRQSKNRDEIERMTRMDEACSTVKTTTMAELSNKSQHRPSSLTAAARRRRSKSKYAPLVSAPTLDGAPSKEEISRRPSRAKEPEQKAEDITASAIHHQPVRQDTEYHDKASLDGLEPVYCGSFLPDGRVREESQSSETGNDDTRGYRRDAYGADVASPQRRPSDLAVGYPPPVIEWLRDRSDAPGSFGYEHEETSGPPDGFEADKDGSRSGSRVMSFFRKMGRQ